MAGRRRCKSCGAATANKRQCGDCLDEGVPLPVPKAKPKPKPAALKGPHIVVTKHGTECCSLPPQLPRALRFGRGLKVGFGR